MNTDKKTVLVVDDEPHIVQVVAIKLRNADFEVITAENGAIALEHVKKQKPDIIVTDYNMPVMNGLELIRNIRKNPETANIPVIMLTAMGFVIEEDEKRQLNISACLTKPFSPREVLKTVNEILTGEGEEVNVRCPRCGKKVTGNKYSETLGTMKLHTKGGGTPCEGSGCVGYII